MLKLSFVDTNRSSAEDSLILFTKFISSVSLILPNCGVLSSLIGN